MKTENVRSIVMSVVILILGVAMLLCSLKSDAIQERCCNPESILQWKCGDPPTIVPKRENIDTGNEIEDLKLFHLAVADFRARSYLWMVCATNFIHKYPKVVDDWGRSLIKKHEVIVQ